MGSVATLPLSPRKSPRVGFFVLPVLADILARVKGKELFLPLNVLGTKDGDSKAHRVSLHKLGVAETVSWSDGDVETQILLQRIVDCGIDAGWLRVAHKRRLMCQCELCEILPETLAGPAPVQYVRFEDGKPVCGSCGQRLLEFEGPCLLWRLPTMPDCEIWPPYATEELRQIAQDACMTELLVSRKRRSGRSVLVASDEFFLDTDFCWMSFMIAAASIGRPIETLLVGNRTLKQAYWSVALTGMMGVAIPQLLLVVPRVNLVGMGVPEPSAESLIDRFGSVTLRFFLIHAMGSMRKEINLDSKLFYLIEHSKRVDEVLLEGIEWNGSLLSLWRTINQQRVREILATFRTKNTRTLLPIERAITRSILGGNH